MSTGPSEASIVRSIRRTLDKVPRCHHRKVHGSAYSSGEPDLDVVIAGHAVKIEVKRPGEKPTAQQALTLRKWGKAGAIAFVATSADEVVETLADSGIDDVLDALIDAGLVERAPAALPHREGVHAGARRISTL